MPYLDIAILLINVFLPGIGTITSGFFDKSLEEGKYNKNAMIVGLCQFVTSAIFYIGGIWAMLHSILIIKHHEYYKHT